MYGNQEQCKDKIRDRRWVVERQAKISSHPRITVSHQIWRVLEWRRA